MTAPTIANESTNHFTSDATTHDANYPATVNAGDLLLIAAGFDGNTTLNTPDEYTLIGTVQGQGGDPVLGIFGKVAEGNEGGGTINVPTSNAQAGGVILLRITGWIGDLSKIAIAQKTSAGENCMPMMPIPLTPYGLDYLYIQFGCKADTGEWTDEFSTPFAIAGYTTLTEADGGDTTQAAQVIGRYVTASNAIFSLLRSFSTQVSGNFTPARHIAVLIPPAMPGTISGTVYLSGEGVSGAIVHVRNQTSGEVFGPATTDSNGDYSIGVRNAAELHDVHVEYDDGQAYNDYTLWGVTPV